MKQSTLILSTVIAILLILGGVFAWQALKPVVPDDGTTPTINPTPTEDGNGTEPDNTEVPEGWKTYENAFYSFSYPTDWKLAEPVENIEIPKEDRAKTDVLVESSTGYTVLDIGLGRPAGFIGGSKTETTNLEIRVGKTIYEAIEIKSFPQLNFTAPDDPNPPVPIYSDKPNIWFSFTGENHKYKEKYPFIFTFGNGYPSYGNSSQKPDSAEIYEKEKRVALEILKTFEVK